MLKEALIVGTGGFAGSALRYAVTSLMTHFSQAIAFPMGTLTVNAIGSLLIGLLLGACRPGGWYYLCVVGFCGGFTTFSTFSADLLAMLRSGDRTGGLLYAAGSIAVCLTCVWLGSLLTTKQ